MMPFDGIGTGLSRDAKPSQPSLLTLLKAFPASTYPSCRSEGLVVSRPERGLAEHDRQ